VEGQKAGRESRGVCEFHGVKISEGGRDGETWLSGIMAADGGTKILLELVAIIT